MWKLKGWFSDVRLPTPKWNEINALWRLFLLVGLIMTGVGFERMFANLESDPLVYSGGFYGMTGIVLAMVGTRLVEYLFCPVEKEE